MKIQKDDKVLFLCRGNVGRSMFAKALYNKMTGAENSEGAGTQLSGPEETMGDLLPKTEHVVAVMEEEGIDVRNEKRKWVTQEMVNEADIIIDMAEQETVPDFVKAHPNRVVWEVADPKGMSLEGHREVKDEIKRRLEEVVE